MKRLLILSTFLYSCTPCPAITPAQLDRLIPALIEVESNGVVEAVGDGGKAYGILQIHKAYLADGNRFAGTTYTHAEMFDPDKSIEIVRAYLLHYARDKDIEAAARIHNGGPNGWKKESTLVYWQKVKKELEK